MLFFKKKEIESALIDKAFEEAVEMLQMGNEMFTTVTRALVEKAEPEEFEKILSMDKRINKLHRSIRKKIYEHLSISGCQDLFMSLVLLMVVNDLERIGDYNKNIAETIEMNPEKLKVDHYESSLKEIWDDTIEFFDLTYKAFKDEDEQSAKAVLKKYRELSRMCDGLLRQIFEEHKKVEMVNKDYIALVLLLRYFKRVNAHLKNIASTVVNPFHRIGYKLKNKGENEKK